MRQVFLILSLLFVLESSARAFSYATGGCADGCASGEQWLHTNGNEIDTALDALETTTSSHTSTLAGLSTTYLALSGGTITGGLVMGTGSSIDLTSGVTIVAAAGSGIEPSGNGYIYATAMSATGQIDDNDLAAGAVDGGTGGEIADGSITTADIADGTVTGTDILNDTVALTTDTSGDYVATVSNSDGYITVSGAGTEGRAVTLALASTVSLDSDLEAKSAATSTSGNVPKFSGTEGDLVDTGVAIDGSNNITTAGALSAGGSSGASTFTMRNMADSGWVECGVSGTTFTCAVDADGTPDGTL